MDSIVSKRWPVIKLFGFEIRLDASWLILALLVTWSLSEGYFPSKYSDMSPLTYWMMGMAAALGLFISIILHELCHSLIARRYKVMIRGITLFVFGGISELGGESPTPRAEFWIAVVGPLFSFAFSVALQVLAGSLEYMTGGSALIDVISYLATINFALAIFNLLPAFPLDGGRILRALLWHVKGKRLWATHISSNIGMVFGVLLVLLGAIAVLFGNIVVGIWWGFLGFFIRSAARKSYEELLVMQILREENVGHLVHEGAVAVGPQEPLPHFVSDFLYRYRTPVFPVIENSQLLGCIEMEQVQKIPKEQWPQYSVKDLMHPCSTRNSVSREANAAEALMLMGESKSDKLLVTDHGKLLGIVSMKDIMDFFSLRLQMEGQSF